MNLDPLQILLNQLRQMLADLIRIMPQMVIAGLVLVGTWIAARFAYRIAAWLLAKTRLRNSLVNLTETLISVLIWGLGVMISMSIVLPGVTPENLLGVLGLGTVAIGFAFKDIFENFLAGVLIMARDKLEIGDMIECDAVSGKVEQINLRDTHLRHLSNELVLVPNSYLFKNPVKVLTDQRKRRYQIEVGVGYSVDLEAAAAVIEEAVKSAEGVDASERIDVFAQDFADSSMTFLVRWWSGSRPIDKHRSQDAVVRAVKRALDEAGMEIPYPYRTLTFAEPLPLKHAPRRPSPTSQPDPVPDSAVDQTE